MGKHVVEKYYTPPVPSHSAYLVLNPEEHSAKMAQEYIKYTSPEMGTNNKTGSFGKLAKYLVVVWCVAAAFILVHQTVYRETVIVDQRPDFMSRIYYIFSSGEGEGRNKKQVEPVPSKPEAKTECTPGKAYSPDGCNTCQCSDEGKPSACTKMICPSNSDNNILYKL